MHHRRCGLALAGVFLCTLVFLVLALTDGYRPKPTAPSPIPIITRSRSCRGCFSTEFPVLVDQPHLCSSRSRSSSSRRRSSSNNSDSGSSSSSHHNIKTSNSIMNDESFSNATDSDASGMIIDTSNDINISRDSDGAIAMVFFILTTPEGHDRRDAIRVTWASVTRNNTSHVRHVFVVGWTADDKVMGRVVEEARAHRDVVVSSFTDSYENLTLKTVWALRWITHNCDNARYFFKTDDDMWVNTRSLLEMFDNNSHTLNTAIGGACRMSHSVIRNPFSKWYASHMAYPEDRYPDYCSGTGYGSSLQVARRLVEVSKNIPFFYLEDVYMGLCLQQLGLSVLNLDGFMLDPTWEICEGQADRVITIHRVSPAQMVRYASARCGEDGSRYLRKQNLLLDVLYLVQ